MRRSHRSAQRQVEKDFTGIQVSLHHAFGTHATWPSQLDRSWSSADEKTLLQNLLKSLPKDASSADGKAAILGKLDQASERVKGLKRKVSSHFGYAKRLCFRVQHPR